uniref:Helitron helicase-like domain-containing protein n=1 Tax=Ananas comosus var. bracteatus TaxID=296719 RepID=A0A6V7QME7_ANACO|nr:unnamed protein product [Ananas comosus var. bracteatus]
MALCGENRKLRKTILDRRRHSRGFYASNSCVDVGQYSVTELDGRRKRKYLSITNTEATGNMALCAENRKLRKTILDRRRHNRGFYASNSCADVGQHSVTGLDSDNYGRRKRKYLSVTNTKATVNVNSGMPLSIELTKFAQPARIVRYNEQQHYVGLPEHECQSCGAQLWYAERIRKSRNEQTPRFSICCQEGKVTLPLLQSTPELLDTLLDYGVSGKAKHFRQNIRTYNSMFAFTSFGAKVDNDINRKPGPYVFKISGQNYHRMGSLLPMDGHRPKFAQLYIYDTENEIDNRMRAFNTHDELQDIDRNIVRQLMEVFDSRNEVVKAFRMARDRFREADYLPIRLRLIGTRPESGSQYNPPMSSEIAGLIIGDLGTADRQRDI